MEPVNARTREPSRALQSPGRFSRTAREWVGYGLCVALLLLGLFLHWRDDEADSKAVLQERLQADAALLNTLLGDKIRGMDAALDAIRESRFWELDKPLPDPLVRDRLRSLADAMDGVRSIVIMDTHGLGVASNRAEMVGVDLSAGECFQALRERADASFLCLSRPFVTPLGKYTFVVSKMIVGKAGGFDGAVMCVVEPGWVAQLLRPLQRRGGDLRLSVVHPSGVLVHSEPASGPWSGGDAPVPSSWWSRVAAARLQDLFVGVDGDGRDRLVVSYPVVFQNQNVLGIVASRDLQTFRGAVREGQAPLFMGLVLAAAFGAAALLMFQRRRRAAQRATMAVHEAERNLRLALDSAALGVWRWDPKTEALETSPRFREIYGLPPDEPLTKDRVLGLVHPDDRENVSRLLDRCLAERNSVRLEHRLAHPDGAVHWVTVTAAAFPDEHGSGVQLYGILRDITGFKTLQSLNDESRARLGELVERQVAIQTISAFAHDLNQPLLAISAYSEAALNLIRRGVLDKDKLTRMLEGSHAQALRAGKLMHELSAQLARALEAQEDNAPFDINDTIGQVVAQTFGQRPGDPVVALELAPGLPPVQGSRVRTVRIIENLLNNAHQANQQASAGQAALRIEVSSRRVDGSVEVAVRDHGPGVSERDAERLFSPFFTTKRTGLGLGLSISRALAESQGGRLELGPSPDPGAEFLLTLPLAKDHDNHPSH